MPPKTVKYLKEDRGRFFYRRRVPNRYHKTLGIKVWTEPCGDVSYPISHGSIRLWHFSFATFNIGVTKSSNLSGEAKCAHSSEEKREQLSSDMKNERFRHKVYPFGSTTTQ